MPKRIVRDVFHGTTIAGAYKHSDGRQIKRAPSSFSGQFGNWELRAKDNTVVDVDTYRADLAKRHNIELTGWAD